ncbi:MAG: aminotransferase class V-fold PLP-dependent enzyme [Caulobacteraceae bacterium]|nr:aminotransferase class V-fold PLP-dependent enzyme [Caulobacteraceae bacterium]
MSEITRRGLLARTAAVPALLSAAPGTAQAGGEDGFWTEIAAEYEVPREVIQLENGNWGAMPRPVQAAYLETVARVNRDTSYYARRGMGQDLANARARLAETLGVPDDEIAFTRNATEALKVLIGGYNRLTPGDAVLYADLDYDSMQDSMKRLALREGAEAVRIALPEPATRSALIDAYAEAFARHPRIRLALLTHVSHRTGLALPVREIVALARERDIDVIVDAAHSWRQLDFSLKDLDCDFVGLNGHKWLTAPLGVGLLHIRKSALPRIDHDLATPPDGPDAIAERVHTGTLNAAAFLSTGAALDFETRLGLQRKSARLRALRDRWVSQTRGIANVEILTPEEPGLCGAITSFRLAGRVSMADNELIARRLLERHRIFTVARDGVDRGACVRVTPGLFNTMEEMDALVAAVTDIASSGAG